MNPDDTRLEGVPEAFVAKVRGFGMPTCVLEAGVWLPCTATVLHSQHVLYLCLYIYIYIYIYIHTYMYFNTYMHSSMYIQVYACCMKLMDEGYFQAYVAVAVSMCYEHVCVVGEAASNCSAHTDGESTRTGATASISPAQHACSHVSSQASFSLTAWS
jgi:hypothetical protein